jgi:hypothetical protein
VVDLMKHVKFNLMLILLFIEFNKLLK